MPTSTRPDKPFLMYYALGAGHSPHHVEPEWIEKYEGRFDAGWDEFRRVVFERQLAEGIVPPDTVLSERDPDVPAWDSLSDAPSVGCTRTRWRSTPPSSSSPTTTSAVVDFIDELGELDNTIIVVMSDNGASAEGGLHGTLNEVQFFNGVAETLDKTRSTRQLGRAGHVPALLVGMGLGGQHPVPPVEAGDLPGRGDRPVHRVVACRYRRHGEVRTQYAHVTDILPTLLDTLGMRRRR